MTPFRERAPFHTCWSRLWHSRPASVSIATVNKQGNHRLQISSPVCNWWWVLAGLYHWAKFGWNLVCYACHVLSPLREYTRHTTGPLCWHHDIIHNALQHCQKRNERLLLEFLIKYQYQYHYWRQGQKNWWSLAAWFTSYAITQMNRQTDRKTYHNTWHPSWGRSNKWRKRRLPVVHKTSDLLTLWQTVETTCIMHLTQLKRTYNRAK